MINPTLNPNEQYNKKSRPNDRAYFSGTKFSVCAMVNLLYNPSN